MTYLYPQRSDNFAHLLCGCRCATAKVQGERCTFRGLPGSSMAQEDTLLTTLVSYLDILQAHSHIKDIKRIQKSD